MQTFIRFIFHNSLALVCVISLLLFFSCKEVRLIDDFTSDGCTLFPDSSSILKKDWCECCFEHDKSYWKGGTEQERLEADITFRNCILEKTGDKNLSELIYKGVRLGGSPYFYNWFRWGYGWPYDRKYEALTKDEQTLIKFKLDEYYNKSNPFPCN